MPKARGEFSPNPLFLVSASGKFSLDHTTLPATRMTVTVKRTKSVLLVSGGIEVRQLPTGLRAAR